MASSISFIRPVIFRYASPSLLPAASSNFFWPSNVLYSGDKVFPDAVKASMDFLVLAKTSSFVLPAAVFVIRSASCFFNAAPTSFTACPVTRCVFANVLYSSVFSLPAFFNLSRLVVSLSNNSFKSDTSPLRILIPSASKIPSSLKPPADSFAKLSVAVRSAKA